MFGDAVGPRSHIDASQVEVHEELEESGWHEEMEERSLHEESKTMHAEGVQEAREQPLPEQEMRNLLQRTRRLMQLMTGERKGGALPPYAEALPW